MSTNAWSSFEAVSVKVRKRLLLAGFTQPTEVQSQVIKSYKKFKDFIIASQTGSGKTLAFGIPILSDLMRRKRIQGRIDCLIMTPTRELAMQIMKHLKPIAGLENPIGCLIGGMSKQKQQRILDNGPRILIATPGRLWEFIEADNTRCLNQLHRLSYLVIDEADRMVELGHFDDLDKIIEKITMPSQVTHDRSIIDLLMAKKSASIGLKSKSKTSYTFEPEEVVEMDYDQFVKMQNDQQTGLENQGGEEEEEEEEEVQQDDQIEEQPQQFEEEPEIATSQKNRKLKTFLVSATLTQQFNKGSRFKYFKENDGHKDIQSMVPKLQSLLGKLGISSKPKIVDLTQTLLFPEKLQFLQAHVEEDDKVLYLLNFIKQNPEQTYIVFLNSILYGKKVASLLDVLNIKSVCLHSLQQQRQRLKKLDAFTQRRIKILVCTDVAARGLDVPDVENVVHYQIPFNADTFVHRCGRTARIGKEGQTLCLVGPKDIERYKKIEQDVEKSGRTIAEYRMSYHDKEDLRQLVAQATNVEKERHQLEKKSRIKDSITQKLLNADLDQDDEDLKMELEEIEEQIAAKKRILSQSTQQYQRIVTQKKQPDQKEFDRSRRNALFLSPEQIHKLSDQMQAVNSRLVDERATAGSKQNMMKQKRQRKIRR